MVAAVGGVDHVAGVAHGPTVVFVNEVDVVKFLHPGHRIGRTLVGPGHCRVVREEHVAQVVHRCECVGVFRPERLSAGLHRLQGVMFRGLEETELHIGHPESVLESARNQRLLLQFPLDRLACACQHLLVQQL